jgi:hypothetical protein
VVLDSTRPRGATEDPDQVLRSPARWSVQGLMGLILLGGLAIAVGAAFAPLADDEDRSIGLVLIGLEIAALGGAGAIVTSAPSRRRPLPAAHAVDGGTELPVRAGYRIARLTSLLAVAALGLTLLATPFDAAGRVIGALMALVGIVFALYGARENAAIRLDPNGIRLPSGPTKNEAVAWRDVHEVAVTGGWRPTLVMTWKGPGLSATHISAQAWPPVALVAVIDHYRAHGGDRAALTDPTTLDQFRR